MEHPINSPSSNGLTGQGSHWETLGSQASTTRFGWRRMAVGPSSPGLIRKAPICGCWIPNGVSRIDSPQIRALPHIRSGPTPTGEPLSLFRKATSGVGGEERLTESKSLQLATDWSRDGRLLYFEVGPNTQEDIWTVPVTSDGRRISGVDPKVYMQTPFRELDGRFSPEASPRWIAYMSNKSGQSEVYIDSFPEAGHEIRISSGGGLYPEWSDTGKELFYFTSRRSTV